MKAEVYFDKSQVSGMDLTLEFTATYRDWFALKEALEAAEKDREARNEHADPIRPIRHCITNLIDAVNNATGHGYKTRGYSFEYQEAEQSEPSQ